MKRVKVRTPSGKISIQKRKEKPQAVKCANCKQPLHGMKRAIPSEFGKLAKTERRPERPYGGYLCSSCMREIFRERARSL